MAERSLVVRLVGDEADLLRSYTKANRATKEFGRQTDTTVAKVDKRFKTLKTAGAGFAGGFIASEALQGLRQVLDVAAESQAALRRTQTAVENAGLSWATYGDQVEEAANKQSRLGFDDEALLDTFSQFLSINKNVNKSLEANNLAMDIARARNIELEQAAKLVQKAMLGQAGALRRVGIDADKNADSTELLTQLQEKFGGAAVNASDDAATANQRLSVALENVEESIGNLLLPTVTDLAEELADVAFATDEAIRKLQGLGNVKIPVINVPIDFVVPGTGGRSVFDLVKEGAKQGSPFGFLFRAASLARAVTGDGDGGTKATSQPIPTGSLRTFERPVVVKVELDGKQVAKSVTLYQGANVRSNPKQKRGGGSANSPDSR